MPYKTTKDRIRQEIENSNISKKDKKILLLFLDCCSRHNQFFSFVHCHWKNGKRYFVPSPELGKLIEKAKSFK